MSAIQLHSSSDRVMIRIYPGTDLLVEMERPAALHLYRLLQRHNWCLSEPEHYADRWRKFWRKISFVERAMLSNFVMANCQGEFSRRLIITDPPADFLSYQDDHRPVALNDAVNSELRKLLHVFYRSLTSIDELKTAWEQKCAPFYQQHKAKLDVVLDKWWTDAGDLHLVDGIAEVLAQDDIAHEERMQMAYKLDTCIWWVIRDKEERIHRALKEEEVI
ncbi:hypothetical protein [Chromobacterium haemolyticum]|uniref:hypothetical protein n=1 Tax=Chromobacterium haemolyticum TaxID=394935 RepID=UPI00244ACED8|nr:hypothetical protein [Chromobacterium haemolyticum]MDH0342059.1 hypothetical protein [Chromobacterium haemolyticum]